jgi:Transposase IS66 family
MQNSTHINSQSIYVPVATISVNELIQRLSEQVNEQQLVIEQLKLIIEQLRQTLNSRDGELDKLTNAMAFLKELVQQYKDEIAILKGQKPKPKIPPSRLEGQKGKDIWRKRFQKNSGKWKSLLFTPWVKSSISSKMSLMLIGAIAFATPSLQLKSDDISRWAKSVIKNVRRKGKPGQPKGKVRKKKKGKVEIHQRVKLQPANIPEGAVFKGYKPYLVQDIIFQPYNTLYLRAQWELPDGTYLMGELPKEIHGHYGPELISYIFYQCQACRVTEPLLHAQLVAKNIQISSGKINKILTQNINYLHEEVAELLPAGVEANKQLEVDDTGGRHKGANQYTTVIGNIWFSVFSTTESKSRVNFLKLLQGGRDAYLINNDTIAYLQKVNVADYLPGYIEQHQGAKFTTQEAWEKFLKELNITKTNEVRFVTEAALFASLFEHGIPRDLSIHSDDAGQFDIVLFFNTLCWIHEERHYRKLIMTNDQGKSDLERVQEQIWAIYNNLKAYKLKPDEESKVAIEKQFDDIFQQQTSSPTLNHQLKKTFQKKNALLGALERADSLLHNNASETAARSAKTKLKVSGGTRSDEGRDARDTFLSLMHTCRKLGINFIEFLQDRVRKLYNIPKLAQIIRQRSSVEKSDALGAVETEPIQSHLWIHQVA